MGWAEELAGHPIWAIWSRSPETHRIVVAHATDGGAAEPPGWPEHWRTLVKAARKRTPALRDSDAGRAVLAGGEVATGEHLGVIVLEGAVTVRRRPDGTGAEELSEAAVNVLCGLASAAEHTTFSRRVCVLFAYRATDAERLQAIPLRPGIELTLKDHFYAPSGRRVDPELDELRLVTPEEVEAAIGAEPVAHNPAQESAAFEGAAEPGRDAGAEAPGRPGPEAAGELDPELVEVVARAIHEAHRHQEGPRYENIGEGSMEWVRQQARAALVALTQYLEAPG